MEWFQKLVLIGEDLNKKDAEGMTALHHASFRMQEVFLMILLKQGALKDLKDCNGMTPLHLAVARVQPKHSAV